MRQVCPRPRQTCHSFRPGPPLQVCQSLTGITDKSPTPTLTISFDCALAPSRAVVYNRVELGFPSVGIRQFALDALGRTAGLPALFTFAFNALIAVATYTISLPLP